MTDTTHHDIGSTHAIDRPAADDRQTHRRHGPPGWSTVLVAVVAAVLASLLTAGFLAAADHGTISTVTAATGSSTTPNWVAVAATVEPSVVAVRVSTASGGDQGSGVVLDTSGRILTNEHVISAAAAGRGITVALSDGRICPATVVGADTSTDLAVLRLTDPPDGLRPATFGNSDAVKVGDPVMAAGNPLGLTDTVTTGIVSALDRPVVTSPDAQQNPSGPDGTAAQAPPIVTNAIQTDAAINPGNSGGALVDAAGQVIGITSSIASLDSTANAQSGNIGLGFAIPSDEATNVARQIIADGTVQHAYLGVTFTDGVVDVAGTGRDAAIVTAVTAGSPAAKAGLRARDAIVAIDGRPLDNADSLLAQVRAMHPGAAVTVAVAGTTHAVTVTLVGQPTR